MGVDVAVIGSGHNGIVAATYLARQGLRVEVFERSTRLGGATLNEELFPGYTFSTGAHLMHAIPAKLARELQLFEGGLELVPRQPSIYLKSDGTYDTALSVELPNHRTALSKLSAQERQGLSGYLDFKRDLVTLARPYLVRTPPSMAELERDAATKGLSDTLALSRRLSLWDAQDHFLPSERLRERFAVDCSAVACNPGAFALASLALDAPDPETGEEPLWGFVRGGMGQLADILIAGARAAGVRFHPGHPVRRVVVEAGRARGLELTDGAVVDARAVLAACDPKTALLKLIEPGVLDPALVGRVESLVTNVSCYKLLAAIDELPEWRGWDGDPSLPARGAIQLEMTREVIREVYSDMAAGRPTRRPMMSFNIPSMEDPSLAPAGRHTASIYIYSVASELAEGSWDDVREREAEHVIDYITSFAPNFRRSIVDYAFRTPLDLQRRLALPDGCIWHLQHTADQILGFRPLPELSGYRTPVARLYLGGSGQHPGGEVSGIPGHNAAQVMLGDL